MKKNKNTKMPNWSTPQSLQESLQKKWDKGAFLTTLVQDDFSCEFTIKSPGASELAPQFTQVAAWVQQWQKVEQAGYNIVWEQTRNRLTGKNAIPVKIIFHTLEQLSAFLGVQKSLYSWQMALQLIQKHLPHLLQLQNWWVQNPVKALALAQDSQRLQKLLDVCNWCITYLQNDESLYIRQIPLKGIHTKFIEANQATLASWLDYICNPELINQKYSARSAFAQRYHFKDKPKLIRFRILDPDYYWQGLSDITVDSAELTTFSLPVDTVFICENDITCLSFPPIKKSIVIFGRGYGFDSLAHWEWLQNKNIWYWGDLDTNGFCILNQLRGILPQVQSFLMDESTLLAHKEYWSNEPKPACRVLPHLTSQEQDVYQKLCNNYWGEKIRLEQELIEYQSTFLTALRTR
jgi:hypothetical protein